ncbi:hypothetical protein WME99_17205 [Sorangium sp. So ce136]|uniref:hypothetical protein n=1 Tax=Sorangium sp. So ce136 TaxID=3133284 RepID=UPI003F0FFDB7
MKQLIKSTFVVGACLAALGICEAPASARTTSPFAAAKPYNSADSACFSEWYGTITNNCSGGARLVQLALPVDTSGAVWGYATAYGATWANTVGCQTYGVDQYVTSYWASPVVHLSSFGSPSSISMSGAYVPVTSARPSWLAGSTRAGGCRRSAGGSERAALAAQGSWLTRGSAGRSEGRPALSSGRRLRRNA